MKEENVICRNCREEIPKIYTETKGKTITGEIIEGVYFCGQKDYRERCFKLNKWKTPRSFKKIKEAINSL